MSRPSAADLERRQRDALTTEQAWLFVLDHAPTIDRYSLCDRFRRWYTEPAEFRADLTEDVVDALRRGLLDPVRLKLARPCPYCPRRGCSTWMFSRAQLTRLRHDRKHERDRRHDSLDAAPEISAVCTQMEEFERATDAGVEVEWLLSIATPGQADAALAMLEGWDDDAPEILGISQGTYRWRLSQLGRAANADLVLRARLQGDDDGNERPAA